VMARITVGSTNPGRLPNVGARATRCSPVKPRRSLLVIWLTAERDSGRQRIALITVGRARVGVLVALGAESELHAAHSRWVCRDCAESIVVDESKSVRRWRDEWSGELLERC